MRSGVNVFSESMVYLGLNQLVASEGTDIVRRREKERGDVEEEPD